MKCCADFVMPLLGSNDVDWAVPNWNTMLTDHFTQDVNKLAVLVSMREEYLPG